MKQQVILVPVDFANQIINYLSTKPFNEVSSIISVITTLKSYDVDVPGSQEFGQVEVGPVGKDPLIE